MNKKRVALALAAALGINTLIVTVGQVGGQLTVAHAQNARLTGEQVKKLDGITIKTLTTTVETTSNNEATLTFKDLTKDNVSDVSGTLSYNKFEERPNTDTNSSATVFWDKNTGKATVKEMRAPGIYSGTVTVTYKDGTTEKYVLTLRKTYTQDFLSIDKVEVKTNSITVSGLEFAGQTLSLDAQKTLELRDSNDRLVDTINTPNDYTFTVLNMGDVDSVYTLVYRVDGVEQGKTQIVITKQETPTVSTYASNDDAAINAFQTKVAENYGVANVTSTVTVSGTVSNLHEKNVKFQVQNGSSTVDVVSYDQSYRANSLGGAKITATPMDGSIKVSVDNAAFNGLNFVPGITVWGLRGGQSSSYVFGEYVMSVGGQSIVYADESSKVSATVVQGSNPTESYIRLNGGTVFANNSRIVGDATKSIIYPVDFEHGYGSVAAEFTFNEGTTKEGQTISQVNAMVLAASGVSSAVANANVPSTATVKTSIIIEKDSRDGAAINATFEKVNATQGKFTLVGTNDVFKNANTNTLATNLKVSGSSGVFFSEKDVDGNPVFTINFDNGQIPSNITWSLGNLKGTIGVAAVEAINFDGTVQATNRNTAQSEYQFDIDAKFSTSIVPSTIALQLEQNGQSVANVSGLRADIRNFKAGDYEVVANTNGTSEKYRGKYSAGIIVSVQPMGLKITKTESNTSGRVDITFDGTFFNTDDYKNVTGAKIQYREKGTSNWTNANVTISTTGDNSDISVDAQKDKTLTKSVTGLTADKEYEFQVIYDYKEGNTTIPVASNIVTQKVSNANNNNNGTITGNGSSSTTTGTSTGSTTITVTTSNSTLTGTSASVTLPSGFRYDSGKTPVAVTFKYKDKDGKIVTETKEQYSNVTARFNGNNVELNGLVPGKDYNEITVDYTDNNGKTRSIILKNVKTTSQIQVETYLANVYEVVFGRPADEAGYHFHLDNLKNKKVSLRDFLLNMLNEKEFVEKYKSTEEKIEALYNAIVSRTSDEAGKKFWVDEYKKVLAVYGSESTALRAIADRMVNENELKELADKMGVQW